MILRSIQLCACGQATAYCLRYGGECVFASTHLHQTECVAYLCYRLLYCVSLATFSSYDLTEAEFMCMQRWLAIAWHAGIPYWCIARTDHATGWFLQSGWRSAGVVGMLSPVWQPTHRYQYSGVHHVWWVCHCIMLLACSRVLASLLICITTWKYCCQGLTPRAYPSSCKYCKHTHVPWSLAGLYSLCLLML